MGIDYTLVTRDMADMGNFLSIFGIFAPFLF